MVARQPNDRPVVVSVADTAVAVQRLDLRFAARANNPQWPATIGAIVAGERLAAPLAAGSSSIQVCFSRHEEVLRPNLERRRQQWR